MLINHSGHGKVPIFNFNRILNPYISRTCTSGDTDAGGIDHTKQWGAVNARLGSETKQYLRGKIYLDWLVNALDLCGNNTFVSGLKIVLQSGGGVLLALRDHLMYMIYGAGVNALSNNSVTENDLHDHKVAQRKFGFIDDYLDDFKNDIDSTGKPGIRSWLWGMATKSTAHKLWAFPLVPFLDKLKDGLGSLLFYSLDVWAALLWPIRFLKSFEMAAPDRISKFAWYGIMSFFNKNYEAKFKALGNEVREPSINYLKSRYGEGYKTEGMSNLGLYLRAAWSRAKEHFNAWKDPSEELKQKITRSKADGTGDFIEASSGAESNPPKGIIDPASPSDIAYQRHNSFTDFVGPFVAILRMPITLFVEPLRCIWKIFGIQWGKNLINAVSSSRIFLSSLRYLTQLVLPLNKESNDLNSVINKKIKDKGSYEAVNELCKLRDDMKSTAREGMIATAISFLVPVGHLIKPLFEKSRLLNFLFNCANSYNEVSIPLLFSARRGCLGNEALLEAKADERGIDVTQLQEHDIQSLQHEGEERAKEFMGDSSILPLKKVADFVGRFVKSVTAQAA